ncbi:hypothetical protein PEX1_097910 [Penicillium expansum]|uniref:Uncharacterized protein n=1 Tax=Penicillium expansum TaxID=27334 RepID=A0A0A2JEG8_PENEN|nr:hypothetical protein PEX2_023550 [Penicillium expansum]KGO43130.1 hypothetical protein PEXP_028480 [Penicillium expansum]KGO53827.1 hypothetical protein PEX2_023550 [Penicillium expansum]KGO65180.1 hypothetical protein PEX1_097910 [Penicillium expansum]
MRNKKSARRVGVGAAPRESPNALQRPPVSFRKWGWQEVKKSETDAKSKADKLGGMNERLPDNIPMKGLISRRLDASQQGASPNRVAHT